MSNPVDLNLAEGLTLHELLASLEESDEGDGSEVTINIMPPINANEDLTDEDSGEEDQVSINNLPGNQLLAEAEIFRSSSSEDEEDDNIPLRVLQLGMTKSGRQAYKWEDADLEPVPVEWPELSSVQNNNSPLDLFQLFCSEEIIDMFVTKTNEYAAKRNKIGNVSEQEMKLFFGILLLSGYIPLPRRRMFWENSKDTHNATVANALSRDRFEYIMSNLHCCNNDALDKNDRFAKVRPFFDALNKAFLEFAPHCQSHSVDESMVPYFGKHGCKQCILNKPIRFGYKMWMGCTSRGYACWIEPYQGAKSIIKNVYKDFGLGPSVILEYADVLRKIGDFPYHIYCDNLFTTIPLLEALSVKNFHVTGTIRDNRLGQCPIDDKKKFKKRDRGAFEYKSVNNKIIVTKWHDNNVVGIASNATPVHPIHAVSRYSRKEKKRVLVTQPHTVHEYNLNMGGVDRLDQNISLYRTSIRGKKWYFCIITHCLDLMVQNAWQVHKRENGKLDHLTFRRRIALALLDTNTGNRKRGRPSSLENIDSRYDRIDHLVATQEKQTRCRVCHKKVKTKCLKCDVALHVDCFVTYHKT